MKVNKISEGVASLKDYIKNIENATSEQEMQTLMDRFSTLPANYKVSKEDNKKFMDAWSKKIKEIRSKSLSEDTIKQNGKWVNKGKEGTHGKFKTKKAADAQRRAMFANGYKESLSENTSYSWKPDTSFKHIKSILDAANARGKYVNNEREEVLAALNRADKKGYTPEQRKYIKDKHMEMWKKNNSQEESLKEANDRILKPADFYFANEKPGEKKKIKVSATKLQSLDKEDLESILENAGNGSLIHDIYDTYWLQKNLRDGKTPTESTVEKSTQLAQNYYAPVPTKYYEEVWKVSGSTKSIYDLIKIIKGKSKYYMVSSNPSVEEVTKHREFFEESLIDSLDESFTEHEKDIIYQALATYDKEYADMDANERDDFDNIHDDIKELLKKVSIMECIEEAYGGALPDDEDSDFYSANGNYYKEIASKTIRDFDGFVTDYTLYMKVDPSKTSDSVSFVTVFGDKDLYRPEDGYYDFECETPQEALEWFRNYNTDEDDIDESLTESAHFDYYDQEVKKGGYTEEEIAKVISIADDYESKADEGVITYDQMDEVASQMGLEKMSDSELRRAWDMYYDVLSRESFKDDDTSDNLDNYKKYSDACSAFAEVINREARRRKEAGNYNPDNESLKEAALNPNFDKEKYGRFFDENNHLIPELADEYFDLVHQEQKAQYDFSSTENSLSERYSSDQVILPAALRKKLNNLCYKYSGFKLPEEVAPLWDELYDLGIEVLIQGPPQDVAADGAKSWTVPFQYNGEIVDNSRFVYSVYEGSNSLKNDYNMYFS